MKLTEITAPGKGITELEGTRYDVDLSLVPDAAVEDYLIVHAGFAIEKLDQQEADERLALFEGLAASYEGADS